MRKGEGYSKVVRRLTVPLGPETDRILRAVAKRDKISQAEASRRGIMALYGPGEQWDYRSPEPGPRKELPAEAIPTAERRGNLTAEEFALTAEEFRALKTSDWIRAHRGGKA